MTLSALDQRFLVHHYHRWNTARALCSDESAAALARSYFGGAGPDRATFQTDGSGIRYSMPDDPDRWTKWAHKITWSQLRRHRLAQPAQLVAQLVAAQDDAAAEWRRHWDKLDEISPSGYSGCTSEQREQLDAENTRYRASHAKLAARVWSAVDALLPLAADNEPADLIEWADQW